MRSFAVAVAVAPLLLLDVQGHRLFEDQQPHSFATGDPVEIKVNKMTSPTTLLPVDSEMFPFCRPEGRSPTAAEEDGLNLGRYLAGDRVRSSPYRLRMKQDAFCEKLCAIDLGPEEERYGGEGGGDPADDDNDMARAVRDDYHHNWTVDGLPAAFQTEDDVSVRTRYYGGFPAGFVSRRDGRAYIHNHVNIEIHYRDDAETEEDGARIVRFVVQPFSIKHDSNPIDSCNPNLGRREHTRYDMIHHVRHYRHQPQPASGRVLFTYDVIWKEDSSIDWSSRWHVYVTMGEAIPPYVHWLSIYNSLIIVMVNLAVLAAVFVRNLRRDIDHYKRLSTDEDKAESILQRFTWRLVHADVFRPPDFSPFLLTVCCGTGAGLLCTTFWAVLLSALGFFHPAGRGHFLMALLLLYALNGLVAGYVTARFHYTLRGQNLQKAAAWTAFAFPLVAFGMWVIVGIVALSQGSTYAVALRIKVLLLFLWLGLSTPLVFLGARVGSKRGGIDVAVRTRSVPRRIPDQGKHLPWALAAAGCLNFSTCYLEFVFIIESVWMGQYYNTFGILLLVLIILVIMCAQVSAILNFMRLCSENYRWWWLSFGTAGSTGFGVFILSFVFLRSHRMLPLSFPTAIVFLGFTVLVSLGLFLMTGFVGTSACLWFNKIMFESIAAGGNILHASDSESPPVPDPESRSESNRSSTLKKALITVFTLASLFSPVLFYPSNSGIDSQSNIVRVMERNEITASRQLPLKELRLSRNSNYRANDVGRIEDSDNNANTDNAIESDGFEGSASAYTPRGARPASAEKLHARHTPYSFGIANYLSSAGDVPDILKMVIGALLWAVTITLSFIAKRRSALPGGRIYRYNQTHVHKILSERRRKLRDILKDPFLREDLNCRYGDLTSLHGVVAEWQSHGFQDVQKKNECVTVGKRVIVPWIRNMNIWLSCITYITFFLGYEEVISMAIFPSTFVHLVDNILLYRAATLKAAPSTAKNKGAFAAVGIPVIEVV